MAREEKTREKSPTLGVIKMISGGSTDGHSNRAQKAWSRREVINVNAPSGEEEPTISFGSQDLQVVILPHNNAIFIRSKIANYNIMRVFVDSGSSINAIFQEALDQMNLKDYQLEPVETALFGSAGHTVHPQGEIVFPLTIGSEDLLKSVMVTFKVVSAPSSYNVILGRLAINDSKVVASTYH
ncbi:uncharacterized protein LOC142528435 [Primulina tabacum]|uniref:uncharacterized protein LOC142528435 n=1 Tax=Primulina tabacum TaxID=48773 RepID=UPI003F59B65B